MAWVFDDGGREAAGYKGRTGDCVTRAIAIATGKPYQAVYDALNALGATERPRRRRRDNYDSLVERLVRVRRQSNSRTGVKRRTYEKYLKSLGWKWVPTMQIGSGCKVHLRAEELPGGTLIARLSRHLCAVVDGVIHDTFNPCDKEWTNYTYDAEGKPINTRAARCVYGYFVKDYSESGWHRR
jgi:hypothetical protein